MGAGALGALTAGEAFGREPSAVDASERELWYPGLAPALAGLRIAHLSDLHLPGNRRAARRARELIVQMRPDLVLMSGDMVESADALPVLTEVAQGLTGRIATFAIHGNWERKAQIPEGALRRAYERAGIEFLVSERRSVTIGSATLGIVGLDDALYHAPVLTDEIAAAGSSCEIWLAHCPAYRDRIPGALRQVPSLLLAGHTHGGQVRLPGWIPYVPLGSGRYREGWYHDQELPPMYVSRGLGTVGVEARLFCPPEMPIITLRGGTR